MLDFSWNGFEVKERIQSFLPSNFSVKWDFPYFFPGKKLHTRGGGGKEKALWFCSGAWTIEAKGPWPPSKFGPHEKKAVSPPPLTEFSAPPESKRGPLTFFDRTPLFGEPPGATVALPCNLEISSRIVPTSGWLRDEWRILSHFCHFHSHFCHKIPCFSAKFFVSFDFSCVSLWVIL